MPDRLTQAAELRARYQREQQTIRDDPDLTREAKQRRLAQACSKLVSDLGRLAGEHRADVERERAQLEREAFGLPPSYAPGAEREAASARLRDALAAADKADSPEAARQLLARAQRVGDSMLVKALANVASERGWDSVLAAVPDPDGSLKALARHDGGPFKAGRLARRLAESQAFSAPPKPQELGRFANQWEIDRLAAEQQEVGA